MKNCAYTDLGPDSVKEYNDILSIPPSFFENIDKGGSYGPAVWGIGMRVPLGKIVAHMKLPYWRISMSELFWFRDRSANKF